MQNKNRTFTVEQKYELELLDINDYKAVYYFRSYGFMIGILYVRKNGDAHLHVFDTTLGISQTTKKHASLMIGWAIYYYGDPVVILPNEMSGIRANALRAKYIKDGDEICNIKITKI